MSEEENITAEEKAEFMEWRRKCDECEKAIYDGAGCWGCDGPVHEGLGVSEEAR